MVWIILLAFHHLLTQEFHLKLPELASIPLMPYAKIQSSEIREASGLIKSKLWNDVYWTLNDSGNNPKIFAINHAGNLLVPEWNRNSQGIAIPDAVNVDWEAITTDDRGFLYIADIGNNGNTRRDLTIYQIPEPYPFETVQTSTLSRIFFYYPEQTEFPSKTKNFDAEAIFWKNGSIYLLTKNRSNDYTQLYQIDPDSPQKPQPAKLVEQFRTGNPVTDACYDAVRNHLLILTTKSIWLFKNQPESAHFFSGNIYWLPITAGQCEAVSFDDNQLIILNEKGELFKLSTQELILVKE